MKALSPTTPVDDHNSDGFYYGDIYRCTSGEWNFPGTLSYNIEDHNRWSQSNPSLDQPNDPDDLDVITLPNNGATLSPKNINLEFQNGGMEWSIKPLLRIEGNKAIENISLPSDLHFDTKSGDISWKGSADFSIHICIISVHYLKGYSEIDDHSYYVLLQSQKAVDQLNKVRTKRKAGFRLIGSDTTTTTPTLFNYQSECSYQFIPQKVAKLRAYRADQVCFLNPPIHSPNVLSLDSSLKFHATKSFVNSLSAYGEFAYDNQFFYTYKNVFSVLDFQIRIVGGRPNERSTGKGAYINYHGKAATLDYNLVKTLYQFNSGLDRDYKPANVELLTLGTDTLTPSFNPVRSKPNKVVWSISPIIDAAGKIKSLKLPSYLKFNTSNGSISVKGASASQLKSMPLFICRVTARFEDAYYGPLMYTHIVILQSAAAKAAVAAEWKPPTHFEFHQLEAQQTFNLKPANTHLFYLSGWPKGILKANIRKGIITYDPAFNLAKFKTKPTTLKIAGTYKNVWYNTAVKINYILTKTNISTQTYLSYQGQTIEVNLPLLKKQFGWTDTNISLYLNSNIELLSLEAGKKMTPVLNPGKDLSKLTTRWTLTSVADGSGNALSKLPQCLSFSSSTGSITLKKTTSLADQQKMPFLFCKLKATVSDANAVVLEFSHFIMLQSKAAKDALDQAIKLKQIWSKRTPLNFYRNQYDVTQPPENILFLPPKAWPAYLVLPKTGGISYPKNKLRSVKISDSIPSPYAIYNNALTTYPRRIKFIGYCEYGTTKERNLLYFKNLKSSPDSFSPRLLSKPLKGGLTFSLKDAPDGVSVEPATGVIQLSPDASYKDDTFTVQIKDEFNITESIQVSLKKVQLSYSADNFVTLSDHDASAKTVSPNFALAPLYDWSMKVVGGGNPPIDFDASNGDLTLKDQAVWPKDIYSYTLQIIIKIKPAFKDNIPAGYLSAYSTTVYLLKDQPGQHATPEYHYQPVNENSYEKDLRLLSNVSNQGVVAKTANLKAIHQASKNLAQPNTDIPYLKNILIVNAFHPGQKFELVRPLGKAKIVDIQGMPYFLKCNADGSIVQQCTISSNFKKSRIRINFLSETGQFSSAIFTFQELRFDVMMQLYSAMSKVTDGLDALLQNALIHLLITGSSNLNISDSILKRDHFKLSSGKRRNLSRYSYWNDQEHTYGKIFFKEELGKSNALSTALSADFHKNFSDSDINRFLAAIMCQTFNEMGAAKYLDYTRIKQDVIKYNEQLMTFLPTLYGRVLQFKYYPDQIKRLEEVKRDLPVVGQYYKEQLQNNLIAIQGQTNAIIAAQEFYDHYCKLLSMGVSEKEVSGLIETLESSSLDIPEEVKSKTWKSYLNWLSPYILASTHISGKTIFIEGDDINAKVATAANKKRCIKSKRGQSCESNYYVHNFTSQFSLYPSARGCFDAQTRFLATNKGSQTAVSFAQLLKQGEQALATKIVGKKSKHSLINISKPALGNRRLYHFNQLNFYFTSGHPFVNYKALAGDSSAPYWLCAEPTALDQHLPVYRDMGIGRLEVGAEVVGRDANGKEKAVVIQSIEQIEPSADQQVVHDLIMSPDASNQYLYYVGDRKQTFYLTSAQLPSFSHYPFAAMCLVKAITIAAPAISEKAVFIKNQHIELIEEEAQAGALLAALQASEMAFDQFILKTVGSDSRWQQTNIHELLSGIDTKDDIQTILNIELTAFRKQLKADPVSDRGFDWSLARTFDFLTSKHMEELATAIEMGWRVLEPTEDPLVYLALTLCDLHLQADYPTDEVQHQVLNMTVSLINERDAFFQKVVSNDNRMAQNTAFVNHLDQVLYFSEKQLKESYDTRLTQLSFSFQLPIQGTLKRFTVNGFLPLPLSASYTRFIWEVKDEVGTTCGTMSFDTRRLSEKQYQLEQKNKSKWTSESRMEYAQLLGNYWGNSLDHYLRAMPESYLDLLKDQTAKKAD